ncbi:MAG: RNA-binding transcriptional accessory protein [Microscillaceae bacterium]|nr:RNA-binding transcriptional accessory protein [Microscillaceae bacterium]MDW8461793.1 Tex family protein [Cytophagales bacterium]
MPTHYTTIAQELGISTKQVEATVSLLDNDATIPFIARYRKEATGSLNEVQITQIRNRINQLRELDKRREAILASIREQGKLTPELEQQIQEANTISILEDLYLPYKPKRRTRATIAKEKGLEPLARLILQQTNFDLAAEAQKYINPEKGVQTTDEALAGARDIIAEHINEHAEARNQTRELLWNKGIYVCKVIDGKQKEAQKFKDYFNASEPVKNAPSHRVLAMRRGEKEGFLSLSIEPQDENEILGLLRKIFVKAHNQASQQVELALKDAYKRLLKPSIETEIRLKSKQLADEEAIKVFANNLRQLLLAPPLGQKNVLAIDPAFRTGCKVVCLDKQGKLLHHEVIFPDKRPTEAAEILKQLVQKFAIEAIAIGNGTASRETDSFVKGIGFAIPVIVVNESGASVYSASEIAREEFPDYDLTVRGAVSIGRRLMDPLAELVKIDPKSIGVGQYQHDVDQVLLKKELDDTVISCVNAVGVELNTASKQLLTYVSGLGPTLAQNIINYRNEHGPFQTREELKKVSRLGEKAFEQAAGFLRIRNGKHPLDASAVHPESYPIVEQMAKDLNCTVADLLKNPELRKQIDLKKYVTDKVGLPTLQDILAELNKPGRDPREQFEAFEFAEGIKEIEDLKVGMKLKGIVTNITNFGAFVDIGVHQDGLVHISQMANRFIKSPHEVVKVQQKVEVTVLEIDLPRRRIMLSMKDETIKEDGKKSIKVEGREKPIHFQKSSPKQQTDTFVDKLEELKKKFAK